MSFLGGPGWSKYLLNLIERFFENFLYRFSRAFSR